MSKTVDYVGRQFGYVRVFERAENTKQGASQWRYRCVCGKVKTARAVDLRRGDVKSCGCKTFEMIGQGSRKHGLSETRVYKTWRAMHDRCYNPNTRTYATHGARGIKVCKRWFKFEHFYADMGPRPDGMTLERKNNDGNYTPSNCCWATPKQQGRNRRSNRILEYNGRKQIVADWAREYGMPPLRLWQRLNRGWSVEKALTTPSLRRQVVRLYSDAL